MVSDVAFVWPNARAHGQRRAAQGRAACCHDPDKTMITDLPLWGNSGFKPNASSVRLQWRGRCPVQRLVRRRPAPLF